CSQHSSHQRSDDDRRQPGHRFRVWKWRVTEMYDLDLGPQAADYRRSKHKLIILYRYNRTFCDHLGDSRRQPPVDLDIRRQRGKRVLVIVSNRNLILDAVPRRPDEPNPGVIVVLRILLLRDRDDVG